MKKLLFILFFIPALTQAQVIASRNNGLTFAAERYVTNSPGNTIGNSRVIESIQDSITFTNTSLAFIISSIRSGLVAGTPTNVVWTDVTGKLQVSTFPTIPAQFNPSAGTGISLTGSYPNITITNTAPDVAFAPTVDTLQAARGFNTIYKISTTKYADVRISAKLSCSLSLTGGTAGTITLQTSPDAVTWTDKATIAASNTGTLTIGLNTIQESGGELSTMIPPNFFYRVVTASSVGTATFTMFQGSKIVY